MKNNFIQHNKKTKNKKIKDNKKMKNNSYTSRYTLIVLLHNFITSCGLWVKHIMS